MATYETTQQNCMMFTKEFMMRLQEYVMVVLTDVQVKRLSANNNDGPFVSLSVVYKVSIYKLHMPLYEYIFIYR